MRIGFLFNHYAQHQVPHAAPYAFELSRNRPELEIIIACSSDAQLKLAKRIGALYPGQKCEFLLLHPPKLYQAVDPLVSRWTFARKTLVLRQNLAWFRTLDALVSPERHCMKLRTHFGLTELTLIHTRHGAGDRSGGFDERSGSFDFTLLPGQKYVDRLSDLGRLRPGHFAMSGWPKLEVSPKLCPQIPQLFDNDHPTVVYNPHFDQRVSSWRSMGIEVLEWFANHPEFNLIFAPHVVMFLRRRRHKAHLPRKYTKLPNILIDKGSLASADMTYLRAADIYLGDVSSQVYEFLASPRPCIFLNGQGYAWKDDLHYFHWSLGQVVEDIQSQLADALQNAQSAQKHYRPHQEAAFAYTFHQVPEATAAQVGARAIADFVVPQASALCNSSGVH